MRWSRQRRTFSRVGQLEAHGKGLALAWTAATGINHVTGQRPTIVNAMGVEVSRAGRSAISSAGNHTLWWTGVPTALPTTGFDCTFSVIFRPANTTDNNQSLIGLRGATTDGGIRLDYTLGHFNLTKPNVVNCATSATAITAGIDTFASLSYIHSTGAMQLVLRNMLTNAMDSGVPAANSANWDTGDANYFVGSVTSSTSGALGDLSLALIHLRALSLPEQLYLAQNPWQVFRLSKDSARDYVAPIPAQRVVAPITSVSMR